MDSAFAVNSTVSLLKKISLGLWLGFTAFAILLMFAFISASISAKKKDIGILRAIGARSADVFMIFWAEALMVALTCLILSIAVTAIICPVLNKELPDTDLINISVMDFGWLNALMMAGVSVVTATIATIIPVLIYSKNRLWTAYARCDAVILRSKIALKQRSPLPGDRCYFPCSRYYALTS